MENCAMQYSSCAFAFVFSSSRTVQAAQ
uniref:Uncharacterized protein n=1 Tax=Anguilla anguilla TaxID=7936 RepID=A0A0E9RN17_ANGAN